MTIDAPGFSDEEMLNSEPIANYEDVSDLLVCLPASVLSDES